MIERVEEIIGTLRVGSVQVDPADLSDDPVSVGGSLRRAAEGFHLDWNEGIDRELCVNGIKERIALQSMNSSINQ